MIAFDWPIWIRALNKRQTFFCTGQFIQYRTMNYDKKLVMLPFYFEEDLCTRNPYKIPKESNIWTVSVETGGIMTGSIPTSSLCRMSREKPTCTSLRSISTIFNITHLLEKPGYILTGMNNWGKEI